ncbi:MAG TPA: DNA alkylation repair protein [Burkholderiaceae bacterium]|nr:DNA alkylation repair protein [Burkholderiaceae bacterium]
MSRAAGTAAPARLAARWAQTLRATFAQHADAARAPPMQAYMKSALPFYGIDAPLRRRLTAELAKAHPLPDSAALTAAMRTLWRQARFREERYAAMELARVGPHRKLLALSMLSLYEVMIAEGAWWDYCDDISAGAVAPLLQRHPLEVKPVLRRWAHGDDLWLRRAALLCQRSLKPPHFDAVLLYDCILASIGGSRFANEFFVRKGIGWALRSRSYAAPDEVKAFLREYAPQLSPLTRREAMKVIEQRATAPGP